MILSIREVKELPSNPQQFEIYYLLEDWNGYTGNKVYMWNGTQWIELQVDYPAINLYRPQREVGRLVYTGRDYQTALDEFYGFIAKYYKDRYTHLIASDLGVMLMEIVAWAVDTLSFYQDMYASESYLSTALLRNSILQLARNVGYKWKGATSSKVKGKLVMNQNYPFPVLVDRRLKAVSSAGYIFETLEQVIFPPNSAGMKQDVTFRQGETNIVTYASTGMPNQKFILPPLEPDKYISSVEVYVNGEKWEEVDFLNPLKDKIFEFEYNAVPPYVRFGDGVTGLIPEAGAEIRIHYVICDGVKGNDVMPNELILTGNVVVNGVRIDLSVEQTERPTGGKNPPSLDEVRYYAPLLFYTSKKAVTKKDWDTLINTYPGVAKGVAIIVRSIESDAYLNHLINQITDPNLRNTLKAYLNRIIDSTCRANHVVVYILASDSEGNYISPSQTLKDDLKNYLEQIKVIPVTIEVEDGMQKAFHCDTQVEVRIDSTLYNAVEVMNEVKKQVEEFLKYKNFGEDIRVSDVYNVVKSIEGVDYAHVTLSCPEDPSKITEKGDMVVEEYEIIVKGQVTIIPISE